MYEQLNMWHVMLEEYFVFFVCDYPRHLGVGRGIVSFFFLVTEQIKNVCACVRVSLLSHHLLVFF